MSLRILSPGLLSTLQDGGRWGFQKEGILVSGAMDLLALRMANLLVGNSDGATALEITQVGPVLRFEKNHLIALAGADLSPAINEIPIRNWHPIWVQKGATLRFGAPKQGRFAYLAVAGSFAVKKVMGSTSTYLRAGIGGFGGRALRKNDLLPCTGLAEHLTPTQLHLEKVWQNAPFRETAWFPAPEVLPDYQESPQIRTMQGPEWDLFSPQSQNAFWQQVFSVGSQSDRMGYKVEGARLQLETPTELLSSAVALGTVQVPPEGQPIVLLADHQTTGGYPRIGQIATVDVPKLVQLNPGQQFSFTPITLQEAQRLYLAQEERLTHLKLAIDLKLKLSL